MPGSSNRKIHICHTKLRYAIILFISLTAWANTYSQSWLQQINKAKDNQYDDAAQIKRLESLLPQLEKTTYHDTLGLVYYYITWRHTYLNQHEEAISAASSSISNFKKSNHSGYELPYIYLIRADQYKVLRQYDLAITDAKAIRNLPLTGKGIEMLGESIRLIAKIYIEKGEYRSAISQLEYTLSSQMKDSLSAFSLTNMYYDLSQAYFNFSDSVSIERALEAISISNHFIPMLEFEDEKLNQKILNSLQAGNIELKQNRLEDAVSYYEKSRRLIPSDERTLDHHRYYETLTANLIYAYDLLGLNDKVKQTIENMKLLDFNSIPVELKEGRSLIYENIASFHRSHNRVKFAETYMDSFYHLFNLDTEQNITSGSVASIPFKKRIIKGLLEEIKIAKQKSKSINFENYDELVLKKMKLIDELIDAINQDLLFESSMLQWREDASESYKIGIDLAYELEDHDAFWRFAEKSKSLALLDGVSNNILFSQQDSIAESVNILHQLKIRESELVSLNPKSDSILSELLDNRQKQSKLLRERDELFRKQIPKISSLDRIKKLSKKHSLIHYTSGLESMYAIIVQNSNSKIVKLNNIDRIEQLTQQVFSILRKPQENNDDLNQWKQFSNQLFQYLIQDLGKLEHSLIVIPEGILSFLPFDALINNDDEYLLFDHNFSYQLSGTFYERSMSSGESINRSSVLLPSYLDSNFQGLYAASSESELICNLSTCYVLDSKDLTKDSLYKTISQSDIFHYAGHAVLNKGQSEDSYLALTDSLRLTEREIYNLSNQLKLVTLSACETGRGQLLKGEGVSNLSRGFIYAGAQSVLHSLWQVNDGSSSQLMNLFYKRLATGESKSTALRNAKLEFINSSEDFHRTPYYWSSFVLIGNDAPLSFGSYNVYYYLIFGLALLLIALIIYRKRLSV